MKKNVLFIFLLLLSVFLISCNGTGGTSHEEAFQKIKALRKSAKSYHIDSTQWNYTMSGSLSSTYSQERFIENDIEYQVVSDGTKRYYDWRNDDFYSSYTFNPNNGKWFKNTTPLGFSDGGIDFWDINNYDYINGSFHLKSQYNVDDQISYKITILSDSSYEFRDEYTFRVDGMTLRRVDVSVVSRFNESFNIKLPTNIYT